MSKGNYFMLTSFKARLNLMRLLIFMLVIVPHFFYCNENSPSISNQDSAVYISSDAIIIDAFDSPSTLEIKSNKDKVIVKKFTLSEDDLKTKKEIIATIENNNSKKELSTARDKSTENLKDSSVTNSYSVSQNISKSFFIVQKLKDFITEEYYTEKSVITIYKSPNLDSFLLKVLFCRPPPHLSLLPKLSYLVA